MHASLTTTEGSNEGLAALATMAGETMLEWLRDVEGFRGLMLLTSEETGTTQVIAFWESEEIAERHRVARMNLRDRITTAVGVDVRETRMYEVSFAHVPSLTEPGRPG